MGWKLITSRGTKITYHKLDKCVSDSGIYEETGVADYVIPGTFVPNPKRRNIGKNGAVLSEMHEVIIPSILDLIPDYSGITLSVSGGTYEDGTIDGIAVHQATNTGIYSVSCSGTCKVYLTDGENEYSSSISNNNVEIGLRYMSGSCEVYRNKILSSTLTGTFNTLQRFAVSGSCSITGAKYNTELEEYKEIVDNFEEEFEPSYDDLIEWQGAYYRIKDIEDRSNVVRGKSYKMRVERETFDR